MKYYITNTIVDFYNGDKKVIQDKINVLDLENYRKELRRKHPDSLGVRFIYEERPDNETIEA